MLVAVKTPLTELRANGKFSKNFLNSLKKEFGNSLKISKNSDEEENKSVNVFETSWYKKIKSQMNPGSYLRIYRQNKNITQMELGKLLGNFSKQNISEIERGKRGISKEVAKKLSKIFKVPIDKFL